MREVEAEEPDKERLSVHCREFELSPEDCRETRKDLELGSDVGMISFVMKLLLPQQCGARFRGQPEGAQRGQLPQSESMKA